MDLGLQGRKALVFGSTSGLGQAIASALAGEGARVAISGRRADLAARIAASLPGAVACPGDLTVAGEPARVVDEATARLGGLDACVANTGGGAPGGLVEVSAGDERAAYRSMLLPALEIFRAATPHLRRSGDGRLLCITARSVVEASPELALSGVFRSGVAAAARSLAIELAPEVLVNVVVPGQFDTPALRRTQARLAAAGGVDEDDVRRCQQESIPLGRFGRATELADLVAFLCSERAAYITGSVIRIDGGAVRAY